jgi:hypothetical protein
MPSVAFAPRPEDFEEDFFGIPVLSWRTSPAPTDKPITPPSPECPSARPVAAR